MVDHRSTAGGEPFSFGTAAFGDRDLRVTSFTGREQIDRLFAIDVVVSYGGALDEAAFEAAVLGQPAWLRFEGDAPRTIGGLVSRVATVGGHTQGRTFRLRLVPAMARLRERRTTRIFQDADLVDVVADVLRDHGVAHRATLAKRYPTRAYCVQYRETDLAFVTRLLAEEGISFYFEHRTDGATGPSTLVLVDDHALAPAIPGDPRLVVRADAPGMPPREEHVLSFAHERRVAPTAVRMRDYDFLRPSAALTGAASVDEARSPGVPLEHYEHHGEFEESDARDDDARVLLEQLRRRARSGVGRTPCRRLAPGHRFTLAEHDAASLDGDYVVTRVDHRGHGSGAAPAGAPPYDASFHVAPVGAKLRPKRPRRSSFQVAESATVSGPAGEDIHTDEHGRVRVRFHWDPDADPAQSSCWMRVVQPWAGEGWGFQFVPRVGMEVLVTFLGGDPDRPVVIGCLPNATHPPPFPLPAAAAKSGIRSRSTPGGAGYNEIAFDDSAGAEVLSVRAQHDYTEETLARRATIVGGDRTANVSGDDALRVLGDRQVSIAGDLREDVDGDAARFVMGATRDEHFGDREVHAYAHDRARVDGSMTRVVGGDGVATIAGHASLTVGTSDQGEAQAQVSGTLVLGATTGVTVRSAGTITLAVGESRIVIDEESITLEAKAVHVKGFDSVSAEGAGPALSLAEHAEIRAKKVAIYAEEARLELEKDAKLEGSKVLLNCDVPDSEADESERDEERKKLRVRLSDATGEPYAGKHYRLDVAGVTTEGETGGDGGVAIEAPADAKIAKVRVWIDEYPEGRTKDWAVEIVDAIPPVAEVRGVKLRLQHLGYYAGPIDDDPADLGHAVRWFQRDADLDPTGELDDATRSALEGAHGH